MALSPTINVCLNSGCTTLTLVETTGTYDAESNTGGYGTPNDDTTDITAVLLTVIDPDNVEYEIDLTSEGFPTENDDHEYEIDLADIGDRSSIEDGYWQFRYTLTTAITEYEVTKGYFFYCNTACCVATLLANVEVGPTMLTDPTNLKRIDNYIAAATYLESLKNAANCYNETSFDTIKALLDKLCRNSGCRTCN